MQVPAWVAYGRVLLECAALCATANRTGRTDVARDGRVLTAEEIARITGATSPVADPIGPSEPEIREAFRPVIERRWTTLCQEDSPLQRIAGDCGLSDAEVAVLAVCGAVELDSELRALCSAANSARDRDGVTVGLLQAMIGPEALAAVGSSVLRSACLIEVDPTGRLIDAEVRLARTVAWALAGVAGLDEDLPADAVLAVATPDEGDRTTRVLAVSTDRVRRVQAVAETLDAAGFLVTAPPASTSGWRALLRQATAGGLGAVLDLPAGAVLDDTARLWMARGSHLSWAVCATATVPLASLPQGNWREAPVAPAEVSDTEWKSAFPDAAAPRRRPTAAQLRLAASLDPEGHDAERALRRVATGALLRHATRIRPTVTWDSLILPAGQLSQLHGLVDRYRQRATVHDAWGLPLYPSPGVVALFAGPSGTGKSTAAQVIATELGVDMFRVDLSALVSKYIGETEKNLEEVFSAAHAGDYLLLFDEADSLFGSRSKVTDARDRYANMEVSYLLQRLETFDGFVVLTSNFQGNIDEAFLRRIHVSVPFQVPTAEDRERIWDRCLAGAPRQDLDLKFVAAKFDLTGGSIRLAALSAAVLAAARGGPVGMVEILQAVDQEMIKLRRRTSDEQFGQWLPKVAENLA